MAVNDETDCAELARLILVARATSSHLEIWVHVSVLVCDLSPYVRTRKTYQ